MKSTIHWINHNRATNNSQSSDRGQTKFIHVQPKPNCGYTVVCMKINIQKAMELVFRGRVNKPARKAICDIQQVSKMKLLGIVNFHSNRHIGTHNLTCFLARQINTFIFYVFANYMVICMILWITFSNCYYFVIFVWHFSVGLCLIQQVSL